VNVVVAEVGWTAGLVLAPLYCLCLSAAVLSM
jgi:hypothetical protein